MHPSVTQHRGLTHTQLATHTPTPGVPRLLRRCQTQLLRTQSLPMPSAARLSERAAAAPLLHYHYHPWPRPQPAGRCQPAHSCALWKGLDLCHVYYAPPPSQTQCDALVLHALLPGCVSGPGACAVCSVFLTHSAPPCCQVSLAPARTQHAECALDSTLRAAASPLARGPARFVQTQAVLAKPKAVEPPQELVEQHSDGTDALTPAKVVELLDKYIIGQVRRHALLASGTRSKGPPTASTHAAKEDRGSLHARVWGCFCEQL